jgi:hypothetical protein
VRPVLYALVGGASGAVAAACILFLRLGDLPRLSLPVEFYVYPGLIFGLAFGIILFRAENRLKPIGAAAFALAAMISNALAVATWTAIDDPIATLLDTEQTGDLMFGITGVIAGAVGGGLLGYCARLLQTVTAWPRLMAAGAGLGLLLPLVQSEPGFFAFYILWQAGYAATFATILAPVRAS